MTIAIEYIGVGSFSILGGGGANQARQISILGGGGGVTAKSTYTHACTYTCMHTHVCMHAQPMHTYILHPDMKIIKIKASDLYVKTATNIHK